MPEESAFACTRHLRVRTAERDLQKTFCCPEADTLPAEGPMYFAMRKMPLAPMLLTMLLSSCSPRDFLTRRLATDLIAASPAFRAEQQFQLRTGVVSNDDYLSPDYLALQHHGWISAANIRCPATLTPPPCWDITLTPLGVDTFQSLIAPGDAEKQSFTIPAARRELVAITGIAKQANAADVEFTWRWIPLNEVGAALFSSDSRYSSSVNFRSFDDGWRVVESASHHAEPLDDALKNSQLTK